MSFDVFDYLKDSIPVDHCRQSRATDVLREQLDRGFRPASILDFGCGDGRSISFFEQVLPAASWIGVDIEGSPEVTSRRSSDDRFVTYDGVHLPFADRTFDLVYSHQVLEHVRHPDLVLAEVRRVLARDGLFIGQTSQFEPYHSFSLWNFTVYGFKRIVEDAGLELLKLRPAIDGFTLMQRTYRGKPKEFDRFAHEESPTNVEIEQRARADGKPVRVINYRKLMFCGIFSFACARKDR